MRRIERVLSIKQQAIAALFLAVVIWGVGFVVVKESLNYWPVFPFLALRFWIAALVFVPIVIYERRKVHELNLVNAMIDFSTIRRGCLAGMALFAAYSFQTQGLVSLSATTAAFLTTLYLVFVPLLLLLTKQSKAPPIEWLAVILALSGIYIFSQEDTGVQSSNADFLLILCAACFAIQILIVSSKSHRYRPVLFTAIQIVFVAVASTLVALPWFLENGWPQPPVKVFIGATILALFATLLAFLLQTWSQQRLTVTQTVLILALEPIIATVAGVLFLHETILASTILGGILILTATLISQLHGVKPK